MIDPAKQAVPVRLKEGRDQFELPLLESEQYWLQAEKSLRAFAEEYFRNEQLRVS